MNSPGLKTKRDFPSSTRKTILLIEDDPECLDVLRALLRRKGHSVFSAKDVSSAEELWAMARDRIDVVVSDNCLGHDRGAELIERFQKQKPGVAFVLCSGLPYTPEVPGIRFLQKPFNIEMLLES